MKSQPKNNRVKRALDKREPKLLENNKTVLFIQGSNSTKFLHDSMMDLSHFKKPDIKKFTKKNEIKPFEDAEPLEFFSKKNDCSIIVFSSNNKKRPSNLTFARFFDYKLYDMIELGIDKQSAKLLQDFRKSTFQVGLRPMFSFNGSAFDNHPSFIHVKSLFLDMFNGGKYSPVGSSLHDVAGLQYVITLTATECDSEEQQSSNKNLPKIYFRVYKLKTFRSGQKLPRVELEEIGPRFDFKIGRVQSPDPDMQKEAMKKPSRQLEMKNTKNIHVDNMGDKIGTVHVGKQDLADLQTRKMKGLKQRFDQNEEEGFDDEVYEYEDATDKLIEDYPAAKKRKT